MGKAASPSSKFTKQSSPAAPSLQKQPADATPAGGESITAQSAAPLAAAMPPAAAATVPPPKPAVSSPAAAVSESGSKPAATSAEPAAEARYAPLRSLVFRKQ